MKRKLKEDKLSSIDNSSSKSDVFERESSKSKDHEYVEKGK